MIFMTSPTKSPLSQIVWWLLVGVIALEMHKKVSVRNEPHGKAFKSFWVVGRLLARVVALEMQKLFYTILGQYLEN